MSRRCLCVVGVSLALAAWAAALVLLVLPVEVSRDWLLLVFAIGIVGTLGGLVTYLQRATDDVARYFYEAGRRDMLREMNSHRTPVVPLRRLDA